MASSDKCAQEFLQTVCKQIRFKGVHGNVTQELLDHIKDQKNEYIKQGMEEEIAAIKAVEQMGDPVLVGRQLDKTHRPKTEWSILSLALLLVVIGGGVQFLLSGVSQINSGVFIDFLTYAPVGIAAFVLMYFFDYTQLGRHSKLVYFLLVAVAISGFLFSGLRREVFMNGAYLHMYYIALLFIPAFAGIIYGFRYKGYWGIIASGMFYAGAAVLCLLAPSFSGFLLLTVSCLIVLTVAIVKGFFGGNKKVSLAIVYVPVITVLSLVVVTFAPALERRFGLMVNPKLNPLGYGWQHLMVRRLISASQPLGEAVLSGDLAGMRADRFLPGWNTDMTLTYIISRLGYVPGLAIAAVLLFLLIRMFASAIGQKNAYGFLVSLSACLAITGQTVFYVLSNLGIIAPFRSTLPFISFGRMGYIVNMILVGLLLSVHRRTNLVTDRLKTRDSQQQVITFAEGKLVIDFGMLVSKKADREKENHETLHK